MRAAQDERHYVAAVLGAAGAGPGVFHAAAAYEASASYAREGAAGLAARLAAELPWARVVLSLREPVSRALSWHAMLARDPNTAAADKCLARVGAAACVAADAATGEGRGEGPGAGARQGPGHRALPAARALGVRRGPAAPVVAPPPLAAARCRCDCRLRSLPEPFTS